ncbi:MAG: hypothetical protein ACFFD4_07825 [Candidatus Odinarchaeota archaeon]
MKLLTEIIWVVVMTILAMCCYVAGIIALPFYDTFVIGIILIGAGTYLLFIMEVFLWKDAESKLSETDAESKLSETDAESKLSETDAVE